MTILTMWLVCIGCILQLFDYFCVSKLSKMTVFLHPLPPSLYLVCSACQSSFRLKPNLEKIWLIKFAQLQTDAPNLLYKRFYTTADKAFTLGWLFASELSTNFDKNWKVICSLVKMKTVVLCSFILLLCGFSVLSFQSKKTSKIWQFRKTASL